MEGRETGKPGVDSAAAYIADHFRAIGLPGVGDKGSYYQQMFYTAESWSEIAFTASGKEYYHGRDYYALPANNRSLDGIRGNQILFLGYGIDDPAYSDYKGRRVKNKILLIMSGEPLDSNGKSRISGSDKMSDWSTEWRKKIALAAEKGASAVMILDNRFDVQLSRARRQFTANRFEPAELLDAWVNHWYISPQVARDITGAHWQAIETAMERLRTSGEIPPAIRIKSQIRARMKKNVFSMYSNNVLGYIEGTDPALKNEVVILSAHYDHLGKRDTSIYYGADDNGSGTSGVLEIATAFAKAKEEGSGPRRSVLCLLLTGEEKGLWGSKYYTSHPIFPLENTVADVNIDMIGRVDDKHLNDPAYIYVIGSDRMSTALHAINEQVNTAYTHLTLDYTYNAKDDPNRYYYRSDHYSFAEKGVPAIFYFNGTHADYHKPSDTIEKIRLDVMAQRARLAFHTAWELANRDERIQVDVKE